MTKEFLMVFLGFLAGAVVVFAFFEIMEGLEQEPPCGRFYVELVDPETEALINESLEAKKSHAN